MTTLHVERPDMRQGLILPPSPCPRVEAAGDRREALASVSTPLLHRDPSGARLLTPPRAPREVGAAASVTRLPARAPLVIITVIFMCFMTCVPPQTSSPLSQRALS